MPLLSGDRIVIADGVWQSGSGDTTNVTRRASRADQTDLHYHPIHGYVYCVQRMYLPTFAECRLLLGATSFLVLGMSLHITTRERRILSRA